MQDNINNLIGFKNENRSYPHCEREEGKMVLLPVKIFKQTKNII